MTHALVGANFERRVVVSPELAINFLGGENTRVLATPNLIWGLEFAARDAILPLLEPGEDSVGTQLKVNHLAATPIGMHVIFRATVLSVEGRRVNFACEAYDDVEKIAEGTHQRVVVDVGRFAERLKAKAALVP